MLKVTAISNKRYIYIEDIFKYLSTEFAVTPEEILIAWGKDHLNDAPPSYNSIVSALEGNYSITHNKKYYLIKKGFGVNDYRKYFYLKEIQELR